MVWECPFIRGASAEEGRVAALPLQVNDGLMSNSPILGCPWARTENQPKWGAMLSSYVLLRAHRGPHAEIVHKMEECVVCAIPNDRGQYLANETTLDAPQPAARNLCAILVKEEALDNVPETRLLLGLPLLVLSPVATVMQARR